jgi:cell division protein DivIC
MEMVPKRKTEIGESNMKKRKRRNRTGLYLVMTVVLLFCGTLGFQSISLRANCQTLSEQKQELEDKKTELQKEKESIQEQKAYMQTDDYIEQVAREKFGLVYDNEIVFKAK